MVDALLKESDVCACHLENTHQILEEHNACMPKISLEATNRGLVIRRHHPDEKIFASVRLQIVGCRKTVSITMRKIECILCPPSTSIKLCFYFDCILL